ncbi:MAG: trypsin-like peptidase domain-containing protein [Cardiobacteriaceae bacterium]|nr:trypsin-like peptidase domain-containing protein [Cardiobacteriaceae bacterium]
MKKIICFFTIFIFFISTASTQELENAEIQADEVRAEKVSNMQSVAIEKNDAINLKVTAKNTEKTEDLALDKIQEQLAKSGKKLPFPKKEAAKFNAEELFARYRNSVVQIQINNEETGQKTAIGSGFVIANGDKIATNYHVVSDVLQKKKHRASYIDQNDEQGNLTLLDFDIVNDLAILQADKKISAPFEFEEKSVQGESLFALGNPHDLGFVIIDGINNGLLRKSAQAHILFSGSLNSGMSGGPTLNNRGKVIGVNVAYLRAGSNISFVVPVEHLEKLLASDKKIQQDEVNKRIAEQLSADNDKYFKEPLAAKNWQTTKIAKYTVPLAMSKDTKCWDASSNPDAEDLIAVAEVRCFNDRQTFINNETSVGQIGYSYAYVYPLEDITTAHFYGVYNKAFKMGYSARPRRDYDNYKCKEGFTEIAGEAFKTVYCRQPGKFTSNGETIDDHRFLAASVAHKKEGFVIQIELYGIQTEKGKKVISKILEQVKRN